MSYKSLDRSTLAQRLSKVPSKTKLLGKTELRRYDRERDYRSPNYRNTFNIERVRSPRNYRQKGKKRVMFPKDRYFAENDSWEMDAEEKLLSNDTNDSSGQKNLKRLKVTHLNSAFTNDDLFALFKEIGNIEICMISEELYKGQLKTGTVEFETETQAQGAIEKYNNFQIMNHFLQVEYD